MSDYRILNTQYTPRHPNTPLDTQDTPEHTDILPDTQYTPEHTDILLERRTATGSDHAMLRRVPASAPSDAYTYTGHRIFSRNVLAYDSEATVPLDSCSELDALFGKEYELWIEKKEVYEQAVIQAVERARRRIVYLTGLNNDRVNQLFTEHSSLGKRVSHIIDAQVAKVPRPDTRTIDLDRVLAPVWNEELDGNQ